MWKFKLAEFHQIMTDKCGGGYGCGVLYSIGSGSSVAGEMDCQGSFLQLPGWRNTLSCLLEYTPSGG